MNRKAVREFVIALTVAICAIWVGSAFMPGQVSPQKRESGLLRKLDAQLSQGMENGVRNMYGLP
ncbi:MAG: hypothetical protein KF784_14995 [Fimbriimonadaceae bacterium]|nr:hypothetical protein [Fimbriimonadaceae bacterium]